jgi:hypothetical protein
MDSILMNYLIWQHNDWVYPKADGRIEIPQTIISKMGWKDLDKIYVVAARGEIIISPDVDTDSSDKAMLCKLNKGRIRIPATISKAVGFHNVPVYMVAITNCVIVKANICTSNTIRRARLFLEGLSTEQKENLIGIVRNEPLVNEVAVPVNPKNIPALAEPELILLDVIQPVVFRVTGEPVYLGAAWIKENKELILMDSGGDNMYLIPGIHILRGGFRIGYLLVDTSLYREISFNILKRGALEFIIWYDTASPNSFKLYVNPPTVLADELLKKTQEICSNATEFANSVFRKVDAVDVVTQKYRRSLPTLVKQNIVLNFKGEKEQT